MTEINLRPVEPSDVDVFYEHQADPAAGAMEAKTTARDRATDYAHWTTRILVNPTGVARTVLVDGAVAGNIVSWVADDGRRLVGYRYGREFWGRGVATQALIQFVRELEVRPLFAYVAKSNVGSRRVLEKTGFRFVADDVASDGVEQFLFVLD